VKLQAINVYKKFKNIYALRDININIDANKIVIIGPNGSGKSTLLSIIYGSLFPSSGKLSINGYEPYVNREKAAKEMSIVFERPYFDINIRVQDVFRVLRENSNLECLEVFWNIVGVEKLKSKLLPELSSGERQLIQLMQALCRESKIKILDEPFAHLDFLNIDIIGRYIAYESKANYIITTHTPEEAEWLGDYFIILREGSIVWQGTLEDLWREELYEVYIKRKLPSNLPVLASMGYVAIVKANEEVLLDLVKRCMIIGFKKVGVRRYYVKK